jgi:hypothetical protein
MSQLRAGPILPLRSLGTLCSLRHWRLLGPGVGDLVLVDAILTPTREPSLLSSQVQQGPGHLLNARRWASVLRIDAQADLAFVVGLGLGDHLN